MSASGTTTAPAAPGRSALRGIATCDGFLLAVAGAVSQAAPKATKLAYEAVYPWITGMAVAYWETQPNGAPATAGATQREESLA